MTFEYFYGRESDLFSFIRVPKALFKEERFKRLSAESKLLYGLLLDRMCLSAENGWMDEKNRVYIVFTIEEVQDELNCGSKKAVAIMKELEECGLIEKKRQGLSKPNLIYVKNFTSGPPDGKFKNCQNDNSGVGVQRDMPQVQTLKTLIHEMAHSRLHDKDIEGLEEKDSRTKEVEAESVAYAMCQYFGIDTSDYSFGYIAGWSSGKKLTELRSSMMTIRRATDEMITELSEALERQQAPLEQTVAKDELALQVGDRFLAIQRCDGGYDYTFYDSNYHGLDGASLRIQRHILLW